MLDWGSLEILWQDIRQAIRTLRNDPGFTLVALTALTIATLVALFPYYHAYVLLHSVAPAEMRALVDKLQFERINWRKSLRRQLRSGQRRNGQR